MTRTRWFPFVISLLLSVVVGLWAPMVAQADDDDKKGGLRADPFIFIGTAAQCGGVAGSHIVTSAWLGGMGLPDNGGQNGVPATANDPHLGLLLNKNGPTADCSSSGAEIKNPPKIITELNFDYRNGGHCGAGAPRFNVTTKAGFTYFFGCANVAHAPATQDPAQWTHVVFNAATCNTPGLCPAPQAATNPPFVFGVTEVKSISIVYDEGTDATSAPDDPNGVGLSVLDNISVNDRVIRSGSGIEDGTRGRGPKKDKDDDDDDDD